LRLRFYQARDSDRGDDETRKLPSPETCTFKRTESKVSRLTRGSPTKPREL